MRSCRMWFWMSGYPFHSAFRPVTEVVYFQHCCYMAGSTWNCCHLGARSVYTIQPYTSLQYHFICSLFPIFLCTVPNVVSGLSAQYRILFHFFLSFFLCTVQNSVLDVLISLCAIPNIVSDMIVSLLLYNTKLCFRCANFHLCSVKYHFRR